METIQVLAWLENMKEIFEDLSKEELLEKKAEFDHTINLTFNTLPKTPIISLQLKDKAFVKNYLNSILRKRYIRVRKSSIKTPFFLIPKKGSKQPVTNNQKLNLVTKKNSTSLLKIYDILNQLIESQLFTKIDLMDAFNQIRIRERQVKNSIQDKI